MSAGAPLRDAATVALLRDGPDGVQAWLLTRVQQMVFAAGMSVFPGGRVDDADVDLPFGPGAAQEVADRFGCEPALARSLLGAGVRETFEEAGVLLCTPTGSTPTPDLSGARADVEAGRAAFGELLRANGLSIGAGGLHPWARWITPPSDVRRYDTRFFLACLPEGAQAQDVTSESSEASWVSIGVALEQAQRGERGLMPPTLLTLASLLPFSTVAAALAAAPAQSLDPIEPTLRYEGDRVLAVLADGSAIELPKRRRG